MKNLFFLTLLIGFTTFAFGQTYLSEDFSANQMPPAEWSIDGLSAQWSINSGNEAGGIAPEAKFTYANGINVSRLISPIIDLTGVTSASFMFKHFLDDYSGTAYTLGVATRSGGSDWNDIWTVNPTGDIGPEDVIIDITNSDMGASDFEICIYINGNTYNMDYWYIDNIVLFTPLNLDAALTEVNLPLYVPYGDENTIAGTIKNMGTTAITSFDISYSINEATPIVMSVSDLDIAFGQIYDFTHDIPFILPEVGTYEIVTTVENINGGVDDNPDNNTITSIIGAVSFIPEKKVFGEEATGTWCGWCIRGICFMDYMSETYPDTWIGVAVHNNDPMVNTVYDNGIGNYIGGYPSALVDRAVGDTDPSLMEKFYAERMDAISPATIDIINYSYDPETRVVDFDLSSEFVADVNHELRFNVVIAEDSLWGTASGWNQSNYYAGGSYGPMCGYENLPGTVPAADMHYDHVAREILGGWAGTEGSLPSSVQTGEVHTYNYNYTIPDDWNYEKMHFIGLLIDQSTGEVLNANNVLTYVGVNDTPVNDNVKIFPNPTTGLVYVKNVDNAQINIFNTSGALVGTYSNFSSGHINLSELNSGIYFVRVQTANAVTTQKVVLK